MNPWSHEWIGAKSRSPHYKCYFLKKCAQPESPSGDEGQRQQLIKLPQHEPCVGQVASMCVLFVSFPVFISEIWKSKSRLTLSCSTLVSLNLMIQKHLPCETESS